MYGTRNAAQCFDAFSEETMLKLRFKVGMYSAFIYHHQGRNAICLRHGDGFILLADRGTQSWFLEAMNEHMITNHVGTLGPGNDLGDIQEIRCLNRLLWWVQPAFRSHAEAYVEWEPDPRHVEIDYSGSTPAGRQVEVLEQSLH